MDLGEDPSVAKEGPSAAEVEAAVLRGYPGLVRLAYLILPPTLGRHRRILSAHGVVQRSLPDQKQLERETTGQHAYEYVRHRVLQDALKAARARTPLRLLPQVWGRRLCSHARAADDLAVDHALAGLSPTARVAWALIRIERLPEAKVELLMRTVGVQHPHAAVVEAEVLTDSSAPPDKTVFDPYAAQLPQTGLLRRKSRGRAVAIVVTAILAFAILASLIVSST
jgi:hypothetical protein